jgi:hypothetical protein
LAAEIAIFPGDCLIFAGDEDSLFAGKLQFIAWL